MIANFFLMLIFGVIGVVCHWAKRWSKKQTTKSWFQYMRDNRKSTIGSYLAMVAVVLVKGKDRG